MKTPGVYIVEKNAFPNSVVEVETAIPAFVGYTEVAIDTQFGSLLNKPWKISSMVEYHKYFGGAPKTPFTIAYTPNPSVPESITDKKKSGAASPTPTTIKFNDGNGEYTITFEYKYSLYHSLLLYFANGGGPCYILSVGNYATSLSVNNLKTGIDLLKNEKEPTLLVIPDSVNQEKKDHETVLAAMIAHCEEMKNRFAILDVFILRDGTSSKPIDDFREKVSETSYGAAYYPWLNTSILSDNDITEDFVTFSEPVSEFIKKTTLSEDIKNFVTGNSVGNKLKVPAHACLLQNAPFYRHIIDLIKEQLNLLPPSAAIAGLYAKTDNTRGVWKAPANISVNSVIKPSISITNTEQENMNVPSNGKSINAIRSFIGEGIKVWGARTLNGNSQDWRYINVRRTMIYLEESIKNAARNYVFEPNDANTWLNMRCMIDSFLRSVWKRGGLAGAIPEDAYSVHIGLGETMTPDDILNGIMRISVAVAISHPAEFIEITFQQQMQKN